MPYEESLWVCTWNSKVSAFEAMMAKIRETTQASDDEISKNLVDLAGHRPDVFGKLQAKLSTEPALYFADPLLNHILVNKAYRNP